jgi:hypothetical protein
MSNENKIETEIIETVEPTQPAEKQDAIVEVTGLQLELFKGL